MRRLASVTVAAICTLTSSAVLVAQSAPPLIPFRGLTDHVTTTMWGQVPGGSSESNVHSISGDGRYVVFSSGAWDLVPDDYNWLDDVFLRDRTTGVTTRVSVADNGAESNGISQWTAISTNGRHVAFASGATNLVPGDSNGHWDVFVRDLDANRTVRVSVANDGSQGDADSYAPSVSADGRYVVFISASTTFAPGLQQYGPTQVYLHDRDTDGNGIFDEAGGTMTRLVSVGIPAGPADQYCVRPRVSGDGRFVMFESGATNLDPVGNPNAQHHVFVRDRLTGQTTLIDRAVTGGPSSSGINWQVSDMSDDGRFITYSSVSPDIVPFNMNWQSQVFLYDAAADPASATTIVSRLNDGTLASGSSYYTAVSADGRFVAFMTAAPNLAGSLPVDSFGLVVRDGLDGSFTRVDMLEGDVPFDGQYPFNPSLSADGTAISFQSNAQNAVGGIYTWGSYHIFVATAFSASPLSASVAQGGGSGSIDVNTTAVSGWNAVSYDDWIVLMDGGGFGAGPRIVQYLVNPNASGIVREGRIRVGSKFMTIHQDGDGDTTPPVITPIITGTIGPDGWYVSDIAVQWSVSDPESEIVNIGYGCASATFASDFIYANPTCEATSHGGTATVSVPLKRDTTAPSIYVMTPLATMYSNGEWLMPSFDCVDSYGYSGVASCTAIEGSSPLDTTPGQHTFTVAATDAAGNTTTKTVEYLVGNGACVTPPPVPGNLRGWWKFDGNFHDSVMNRDAMWNAGAGTFQSAVVNQGWSDAVSGNFLWAWEGSAVLAGQGLTVAVWVNPYGMYGESGTIVSNPLQYRIARYPDGTLRWAFNQTTGFDWVTTGVKLPAGVWTHVAITYKDGLVRSYLNGRLVHSTQLTGTLTTTGNPFTNMTIGGRNGVMATLIGTLDDLMIFDDALSPSDVNSLALSGSGSLCAPFASNIALTAPATIVYGTVFQVSALLTDGSGRPLANRPLTITSAVTPGYVWNVTTDATGSATVVFPINSSQIVGDYPNAIAATFDGDDGFSAAAAQTDVTLLGGTPTLNWSQPAAITYGTALGSAQLNATTNFPGTIVYSPAAGTILDAGTHTLSVTLTPTDTEHWAARTVTTTIVVNKAMPAVEISSAPLFYTGQPRPAMVTVHGIGGAELTPFTILYNGGTTLPVNAGTYPLQVSYSGSANYEAVTATGTLVIDKATPIMGALGDITETYDGLPHGVTVNVAGVNNEWLTPVTVVYNGSTTTPIHAGVYTIDAHYDGSANYNAVSRAATLTILKAAPSLTWTNPASVTYGTPLGATQLNATTSVAGTFVYEPPAGTVLGAGTHTLSATFTPADAANYNGATANVTITVAKAAPAVTWPNPVEIVYGTALGATQLNASANVAGTFAYSPAAGIVLNAGSQTLAVTFTPTDAANYNGATANVTINVAKAATSVTWPAPSPIVYGTALSAAQLNATASVPGTFAYSPAAGTVPGAGSAMLSVTFTPTDSANYNESTASRLLTVTPAPLTIRATDAAKAFGAPLPPFSVTGAGFVNGDSMSSLSGSLTFSTAATQSSPVGSYAITPAALSSSNYAITFANGVLTVVRASTVTSVAASSNPDGLNEAVTLTAAVAPVAPGAGMVSGVVQFFDGGTLLGSATLAAGAAALTTNGFSSGSHTISATYAGSGSFDPSSGSGGFTVNTAAASSTTAVTSSANPSTTGQNVTLTAKVTAPGGLSGDVSFYDGATLIGTVALSGATAQLTTASLAEAGHAITARYLGNATIPPSTSPAFAQYVQPAGASTRAVTAALAASPSPATLGSTVTLTATVTGSQNKAPGGVVLFMLNGSVLGQATLSQTGKTTAAVSVAASSLPHGTHKVEAVYLGDATFRASRASISLVVQ